MNKAKHDHQNSRIAKEYIPINLIDEKRTAWCADNVIQEYWEKRLKRKEAIQNE